MEVDIFTNVFHPVEAGQPYLVIASAFAAEDPKLLGDLGRSVRTHCFDDAKVKSSELAIALRASVEKAGWRVRHQVVKHR